ncbi:hypothetical protein [Oceanisphaera litoralis]|nr:hypothetical protein [Oceanisphaera litoralis]
MAKTTIYRLLPANPFCSAKNSRKRLALAAAFQYFYQGIYQG